MNKMLFIAALLGFCIGIPLASQSMANTATDTYALVPNSTTVKTRAMDACAI